MQRYSFFLNWRIIFCKADNLSRSSPAYVAGAVWSAVYFILVQLHLYLFFFQGGLVSGWLFAVKNFAKVGKKVGGFTGQTHQISNRENR